MKSLIMTKLTLTALLPIVSAVGSPIGYGAGTTGGGSAAAVTVTSCSALKAAVLGVLPKVVKISGILNGCGITDVGSNTSILGVGSLSGVINSGFRVRKGTNVIFQNLALGPAPPKGDILAIDESTKIWVDHNTITSLGLVGGKDDLDGLLDISHAADFITVSYNKFADHWKGSLVGHSANNAAQDTGKLHVTYHHNSFTNVNSRLPSVRFGTVHIFNNAYSESDTSGVNSREGAQVYAEKNVFANIQLALVTNLDSNLPGNICDVDNLLTGTSTKRITQTCSLKIPYSYTADATSAVVAKVAAQAGHGKITV